MEAQDYKKIIKSLRYCGNFMEREGCDESCAYFNDMDCPNRIMSDAADAIESLQKELDAANHQLKMYSMCPFDDEEEEA